METYSKFRPTPYDGHIKIDTENPQDTREDWFVLGISQTRDSDALTRSNFTAALAILGGESDTCEVHRFGHWGPGWFEIILIHPSRESEGNAIEAQLDDYPILDEEAFSDLEYEEYLSNWGDWACSDFVSGLIRKFDLSDLAADKLRDRDSETMRGFFQDCNQCGDWYHNDSVNVESSIRKCERADMAAFLRGVRTPA